MADEINSPCPGTMVGAFHCAGCIHVEELRLKLATARVLLDRYKTIEHKLRARIAHLEQWPSPPED